MPCPIRFGPEPRMSTLGRSRAARPRSPVARRWSSGTACWRRTRRRRCRRSCRPAGCPSRWRSAPHAVLAGELRAQRGDLPVGQPVPLGPAQQRRVEHGGVADLARRARRARDLVDEPRVDAAAPRRPASTRGARGAAPARRRRAGRRAGVRSASSSSSAAGSSAGAGPEAGGLGLHRPHRLAQRLGEVAAHRHGLADALHRGGQPRVGAGELLEREPRDLHHDVVQRRLERRRGAPGDVVGDLVEGVADGQLRGDLGDREAGRLGRQRATTGTPAGSSR